jgi:Flp pilus assembly pilin Flp
MKQPRNMLTQLLKRIHRDERGGVSIETVLIIAAIALPILIFLIKVGWPRMQAFFNTGMDSLEQGAGTTNTGS